MLLFLLDLHTLDDFLDLHFVAQDLHQVDDFHVLVLRILEDIIHPLIALSADVDEYIRRTDFCDVLDGRLVRMQVNPVADEKGDFRILGLVTGNLPYPVIFRKDSRYDFCLGKSHTGSREHHARNHELFNAHLISSIFMLSMLLLFRQGI